MRYVHKQCAHIILNIYAAVRGGLENKMKLKKGFVLRELAGECVVVSTNSELNLNGIITLNSTAKTIWLALESGVEDTAGLVSALVAEYDVTEELATTATENFLAKLKELNFLD